jgi:hypothetical protein
MAMAYGDVQLIWLSPQRLRQPRIEHFQRFVKENGHIATWELVDGAAYSAPVVAFRLRRILSDCDGPLMAVGFTSLYYAAASWRDSYIWCVNGIPEEDVLSGGSLKSRLYSKMLWRSARLAKKPRLIVSVSEPMSSLMRRNWPRTRLASAPNCVRNEVFSSDHEYERRFMTYLGTGAAWQGLGKLSKVWGEMYRLDPSTRYRVISRDDRCRILASQLPAESIEFVAVENADEVARLLWEAEAGFLLRADNLVNRVSYPTKLGEYVAAGAYVVTSDIEWDPGALVRQTGCGILVTPDASAEQIAAEVVDFRARRASSEQVRAGCLRAAQALDRGQWARRLASELVEVMNGNRACNERTRDGASP